MEDGLSNFGTSYREVMVHDREGFIWIATNHGLSRFDGISFKTFLHDPNNPNSLGNNFTTSICEADDGKIWVGTADEGLFIFDPKTEIFEAIRQEDGGLCGNGINYINKDAEGNMWLGTRYNGTCKWVKETREFEKIEGLKDGMVFYQQKNGQIWLGNSKGLFKMLPDGSLKLMKMPGVPEHWRYRQVQDMEELPNGKFIITSSRESFWEFDPETEHFRSLLDDFSFKNDRLPHAFLPAENNKMWIATTDELWHWNPLDNRATKFFYNKAEPFSLPPTTIFYLYQDKAENLWTITVNAGVAVTQNLRNPFKMIGEMTAHEVITLDSERVLIYSADKGTFIFNPKNETLVASDLPVWNKPIVNGTLMKSKKNELLIWNGRGQPLLMVDLNTNMVKQKAVANFAVDVAGDKIWDNLLYLSEDGMEWIDAFPEFQKNIPNFIERWVYWSDLATDEDDKIWIATTRGLFHYDFATQQGKRFLHDPSNANSLPTNVIYHIYKGKNRRIYLATPSGISIYNPLEDIFINLNSKNGLLHEVEGTLIEDNNENVWIGTPLGLQKYNLNTGQFSNFDITDGLPDLFIHKQTAGMDELGYLYFSAGSKTFRFHPDSFPVRDYVAPVHLMDFYINHQKVEKGKENGWLKPELRFTPSLTLQPEQHDFGFSYTMPVFYKPEKTTYFYRLKPYQEEWQSAGNSRAVHYTNINADDYTFEVKAQTVSGFWSTETASIKITVLPFWYQTWWAKMLLAGLIMLGLYSYYQFQLRRKLEVVENRRLKDLNILKTRLYTNITHEFRTPLTVIMGIAEQLAADIRQSAVDSGQQSSWSRGFALIQRNSRNLLRLINQLLDLSKLDAGHLKLDNIHGNIVNYLQYLTESFYSMATENEIRLTFYSEEETILMDYDEDKIQHIVYNLLSNAIKFTEEEGKVIFHVLKAAKGEQPWLKMKIKDTGKGIAADKLPHIFDRFYQANHGNGSNWNSNPTGTGIGLALTKELVELMQGTISVKSEVGKGTEFIIQLPIKTEIQNFSSSTNKIFSITPNYEMIALEKENRSNPPLISKDNLPELLIIEDNKDVRIYIQTLLKKDYNIRTARNGQKGIEQAIEHIPDIIISDVMMPQKDGFEVCATLKQDERTSHIPIILLTAKATHEAKIQGLQYGADAYLTKPFQKDELLIRLEKLVELRRQLQERYGGASRLSPNDNIGTKPTNSTVELSTEDIFLQKLHNIIQTQLHNYEFKPNDLAQAALLSPTQLYRKLKALTGKTPSQFIRSIRLEKGKEMLLNGDKNISEIAYEVGFADPNYFSRMFQKEYGKRPRDYKNKF